MFILHRNNCNSGHRPANRKTATSQRKHTTETTSKSSIEYFTVEYGKYSSSKFGVHADNRCSNSGVSRHETGYENSNESSPNSNVPRPESGRCQSNPNQAVRERSAPYRWQQVSKINKFAFKSPNNVHLAGCWL